MDVSNYLMCADKSSVATVDGLNQKFILLEKEGRTYAKANGDVSLKALGDQVLCKLPVDEVVQIIHSNTEMSERFDGKGFEGAIWHFAEEINNDKKIASQVGSKCKSCEFRSKKDNKKSGFNECWNLAHGLSEEELERPFVFDLWNYRSSDKNISAGKILIEDLDLTDLKSKPRDDGKGLSSDERRCLQVEKVKENDRSPFIDSFGLKNEMSNWEYPLHMIDFETCMVAIPFNKVDFPEPLEPIIPTHSPERILKFNSLIILLFS